MPPPPTTTTTSRTRPAFTAGPPRAGGQVRVVQREDDHQVMTSLKIGTKKNQFKIHSMKGSRQTNNIWLARTSFRYLWYANLAQQTTEL